jgi:Golgi phosphoprotein 3 (GPP34)
MGNLARDLVLLGLNPSGRVAGSSPGFDFALAGAVLLDLVLAERIDVVDKRIAVLDATPLGDPVLDEAVAAIAAGRPRRAKDWIRRLSRGLRKRVLAGLVRDGLVRMRPVHVLRIFPAVRYPVTDPAVVTRLRQGLDTAVRGGGTVAPRAAALCSLLAPAGLDRRLFPDVGRRELRKRLDEISRGNWASDAVKAAVREVQAATAAIAVAIAAGGAASGG